MKTLCCLLGAAALVCAQAPTVQNARVAASPQSIVATINGKPYTAVEMQALVDSLPKAQRANYERDPKQFLQQYAQMLRILELAEKDGLAAKSPYREQLADLDRQYQQYRRQVLYTAAVTEKANTAKVTTEEMRRIYDANPSQYTEAKVKVIYIPFSAAQVSAAEKAARGILSEAEARAKAEEIVKQARAGANFVKLVKEHSEDPGSAAKDGDFGTPIRPNSDKVPLEVRKVVLAAKQGDVTDPVRTPNGFYVFRIESSGVVPFEQAQNDLYKQVQSTVVMNWLNEVGKSAGATLDNEAWFTRQK